MPDTKGSALPAANFAEGIELLGVETATAGGAKKSVRAGMSAIATKVAEINGGGGLVAPTLLSANYQMLAADAGIEFVAKAGCSQVVLPDLAGSPSPAAGSLFLLTNVSGQEIQFGRAGAWNIVPGGTSLTIGVLLDGSTKSYYAIKSGSSGGGGLTGPKVVTARPFVPLPLDAEPCETNNEAWAWVQFFFPFVWSRPNAQIDQLSTVVTTVGGNARLALFNSASATGLPTLTDGAALYDSGAVAMNATGRRSFGTMSSPVTLVQGNVYWLGYVTSNAALRVLATAPFRENDVNGGQFRRLSRVAMVGLTAALVDAPLYDQFNLAGLTASGTITDPFNLAGAATSTSLADVTRIPFVYARVSG